MLTGRVCSTGIFRLLFFPGLPPYPSQQGWCHIAELASEHYEYLFFFFFFAPLCYMGSVGAWLHVRLPRYGVGLLAIN